MEGEILMEDKEKPVTPTEEKKEEKLLTQAEVDELIKDRLAREKNKFAKDLGIGEDFDKSKYDEYKKFVESQKTEADKLAEKNAQLEKERDEALKEVRNSKIERITDNVLQELSIDTKYSKTVLKLADFADIQDISNETLKPIIEKTINEELPMLINEEKTKIGVDKPEDKKIISGAKDYLDKKYANNPYYNK
jgi:hypothetical protein